jgi:hypothetical protein
MMMKKWRMAAMVMGLVSLGWAQSGYYYMNGDRRVDLTPVDRSSWSKRGMQERRFVRPDGEVVTVGQDILVRFKDEKSADLLIRKFGLQPIRKIGSVYLLRASDPDAALRAANALNGDPAVRYAQPDLKRHWKLR